MEKDLGKINIYTDKPQPLIKYFLEVLKKLKDWEGNVYLLN